MTASQVSLQETLESQREETSESQALTARSPSNMTTHSQTFAFFRCLLPSRWSNPSGRDNGYSRSDAEDGSGQRCVCVQRICCCKLRRTGRPVLAASLNEGTTFFSSEGENTKRTPALLEAEHVKQAQCSTQPLERSGQPLGRSGDGKIWFADGTEATNALREFILGCDEESLKCLVQSYDTAVLMRIIESAVNEDERLALYSRLSGEIQYPSASSSGTIADKSSVLPLTEDSASPYPTPEAESKGNDAGQGIGEM
jgi:hypothetical protein